MTPTQQLWVTSFNFGPAIVLSIYKEWWVGIAALVANLAFSLLLFFLVSNRLPAKALIAWAWLKPPIVAVIVLWVGWRYC